MLENTFQHGRKQIKTRNLFFSRTPRTITDEFGDISRFYDRQNGNDASLRRVRLRELF